MKRLLAILFICMLALSISTAAFAAETETSGATPDEANVQATAEKNDPVSTGAQQDDLKETGSMSPAIKTIQVTQLPDKVLSEKYSAEAALQAAIDGTLIEYLSRASVAYNMNGAIIQYMSELDPFGNGKDVETIKGELKFTAKIGTYYDRESGEYLPFIVNGAVLNELNDTDIFDPDTYYIGYNLFLDGERREFYIHDIGDYQAVIETLGINWDDYGKVTAKVAFTANYVGRATPDEVSDNNDNGGNDGNGIDPATDDESAKPAPAITDQSSTNNGKVTANNQAMQTGLSATVAYVAAAAAMLAGAIAIILKKKIFS